MTLTITTYDWVPEFPRGHVSDIRARWTCAEAGLPYRIETVPFRDRTAGHLARQPFHQVPMLKDGDVEIFESAAMLLHIAGKSPGLMPRDPVLRAEVLQWVIAALNSVEMWTIPWTMATWRNDDAVIKATAGMMDKRLAQLETVLTGRHVPVGDSFSAADILMADVLRLVDRMRGLTAYPALRHYTARMTARPPFARSTPSRSPNSTPRTRTPRPDQRK